MIKESKAESPEKWTGEVPEEVKMMKRMNNTSCEAVPKLKAYRRYLHVRKHRIYMEFCPYSDLDALNLRYKRFRFVNPCLPASNCCLNHEGPIFPSLFYGTHSRTWSKQLQP